MADITTFDQLINALSNNQFGKFSIYEYVGSVLTSVGVAGASGTAARVTSAMKALPTPLPGIITKYRPLYIAGSTGDAGPVQGTYLIAKAINLGSVDTSVTSGGFTDGSAMPTRTELGTASAQTYGPILLEVTTVLGGTQGTLTITYTDDAGNTSQTTTFVPTNSASVGSAYILWISGKQGVRDITNVTRAGGTAPTGIIKMWGLLPLGILNTTFTTTNAGYNFVTQGFNFMELGAGDVIKIINLGSPTAIGGTIGQMYFMGEV